MDKKDHRAQLKETVASLKPGDMAFLDLLARDLGYPPISRREQVSLSQADEAIQWELVWRLRPEFPWSGKRQLPTHSNPFLRLKEARGEVLAGNGEAVRLLRRAREIENHPAWRIGGMEGGKSEQGMGRYLALLKMAAGDPEGAAEREGLTLERAASEAGFYQELMTRMLMRGRPGDAVAIVRTHGMAVEFEVNRAVRSERSTWRALQAWGMSEFLPLALFAYGRVRTTEMSQLTGEIESWSYRFTQSRRAMSMFRLPASSEMTRRDSVILRAMNHLEYWIRKETS